MKKMIFAAALLAAGFAQASAKELTVYSVYEAERLAPIFKPFTDRTGITVNVVVGKSDELIEKLRVEGASTPADLYLDKDIVYLGKAQELDLFQAFSSKTIESKIPAHLIDANKNWLLIFYRARIMVYNSNKVSASELSTYEDLGSDKWKGRLCVRTSANSYNEALGAYFVKHLGAEKTLNLFASWVKNLSVDPIKGDTDVIKAVAAGTCDVGIANSYYLAPLVKADAQYPVKPFFPNQNGIGTHVNGVGIGLTKHTAKTAEATLLLEYLTSKEVQTVVAAGFSQYPSNPEASLSDILVEFGSFKQDSTNLGLIAPHVPKAKALMGQAGYK
ncbi:iron ABC transporter [Bdellovibrio bacteriovorus]|uniref:Iron ABC transporter n=1 Tax=Bdellovibrio bacteriovorus TaxID=959 RepID=A0A150WJ86_BDEBC|nr:extracellular solute-binding protein [Bdellovibrio bacteriovorus]KYG63819.1 iron ABC transporter [Bdellovibrio bacteriovorus]